MSGPDSVGTKLSFCFQRKISLSPHVLDWRTKGYVTSVKNQGQCGSYWAFSVTGILEGQIAKKTHQLISLSEQQLVDCSTAYGNYGFNGAMMDYSYKYLVDNHGFDTNASYPYQAVDGKCRFNVKTVATDVTVSCFDLSA